MAAQICLLVSDDLDDHQAISEALSLISENTVLLNIIDSQKALLFLQETEYHPDYLILDLSMHGIKVNSILNVVRRGKNKIRLPIILYGTLEEFSRIENNDDLLFFDKDFKYSELRIFLTGVFK
jgi:hypothetical protein